MSQYDTNREKIKDWLDYYCNYYDHVAGVALTSLNDMYGDTLSQKDVDRVIESLQAFKQHLPPTY